MNIPYVFDIKRSSLSDGDGMRTVIFFKGCNLDCFWCHNPEGKSAAPQLAFFADKCTGCGVCRRVCLSPDNCKGCFSCTETCHSSALRGYGKKYTAKDLLNIVLADKLFYAATGGGVTFSGGECMLYADFLASTAKLCHNKGINVAIDTAGCVPFSEFEKVLPYVDSFLYDIKALDEALHIKGTGKSNRLILENLERLMKTGKKITVRVPVIPDFNEGEEIERIGLYCGERGLDVEFLPYHEMGEDKKKAIAAFNAKISERSLSR